MCIQTNLIIIIIEYLPHHKAFNIDDDNNFRLIMYSRKVLNFPRVETRALVYSVTYDACGKGIKGDMKKKIKKDTKKQKAKIKKRYEPEEFPWVNPAWHGNYNKVRRTCISRC